jgi:undecaprenyl pyrophosphate phosphatase UppP
MIEAIIPGIVQGLTEFLPVSIRAPMHVFAYYRFVLAAVIIAGIWLRA